MMHCIHQLTSFWNSQFYDKCILSNLIAVTLVCSLPATTVGGGYINGTAESIASSGMVWTLAPFGIFIGLILGKMRGQNSLFNLKNKYSTMSYLYLHDYILAYLNPRLKRALPSDYHSFLLVFINLLHLHCLQQNQ